LEDGILTERMNMDSYHHDSVAVVNMQPKK